MTGKLAGHGHEVNAVWRMKRLKSADHKGTVKSQQVSIKGINKQYYYHCLLYLAKYT